MKSSGTFSPFPTFVDPLLANHSFCIVDADFRFMATSDLTNELLSPAMEGVLNDAFSYKVVDAVLNTLQDKNGEVQNMGVKWWPLNPNPHMTDWGLMS